MANVFNAAEIIDMGIAKERKRRDFYGLVSAKFKDKKMKDLFSSLRDWEEEHIRKFTDIRNSVGEMEIRESYQGEFASYIKAMVDDMLYKQVSASSLSKFVKNPLSAITIGIGFEKDAILFFGELLKFMPSHNRDAVEKLIEEEKRHIIYLSELKRKYE